MTVYCDETINEEYVQKNNINPFDTIIIQNTAKQNSEDLSKINPSIHIRVIRGL